jgi:hypothetical protein
MSIIWSHVTVTKIGYDQGVTRVQKFCPPKAPDTPTRYLLALLFLRRRHQLPHPLSIPPAAAVPFIYLHLLLLLLLAAVPLTPCTETAGPARQLSSCFEPRHFQR